jgi:hypothetical protein
MDGAESARASESPPWHRKSRLPDASMSHGRARGLSLSFPNYSEKHVRHTGNGSQVFDRRSEGWLHHVPWEWTADLVDQDRGQREDRSPWPPVDPQRSQRKLALPHPVRGRRIGNPAAPTRFERPRRSSRRPPRQDRREDIGDPTNDIGDQVPVRTQQVSGGLVVWRSTSDCRVR